MGQSKVDHSELDGKSRVDHSGFGLFHFSIRTAIVCLPVITDIYKHGTSNSRSFWILFIPLQHQDFPRLSVTMGTLKNMGQVEWINLDMIHSISTSELPLYAFLSKWGLTHGTSRVDQSGFDLFHCCIDYTTCCRLHHIVTYSVFAVIENMSHPGYWITLGFHTCWQPTDFALWSFWSWCRSQLSVSQLLGNDRFWCQTTMANRKSMDYTSLCDETDDV